MCRLDPDTHRARPFRVHAYAHDYRLLDCWAPPVTVDDFAAFVQFMRTLDPAGSRAAAALFRLRRWLGAVLRWDADSAGFVPVYEHDDEALFALSNATIHALLHVACVDRQPTLAVYARHRGALSTLYMALIGPFRHLIVYPALMKKIAREWPARAAA